MDFLTLPLLGNVDGLVHGFLTRRGGVSPPPYDELNLAISTGDDVKNVRANLDLVRSHFGLDGLAAVYQVHGTSVSLVDGDHHLDPLGPLVRADAMITRRAGAGLLIKLADCLGLILCDPKTKALAAVHAGWRGLVAGVIPRAVRGLVADLGAEPARVLAGIGPSLGPCCAEFVNYRTEFPPDMWRYVDQRCHVDLWALARDQMIASGLKAANIEISGRCTRCEGDLFFSHRGQGPKTGRTGLVAGWEKN